MADLTYPDNITTNDDMLHLKGIDLNVELVAAQVNDINDDAAARAINDVETWMINYININYSFQGTRSDLNDFQKGYFKKAVCEQIDYILDNGDLRNLSGIDSGTGMTMDKKIIESRVLAPNAYNFLHRCGLANYKRF